MELTELIIQWQTQGNDPEIERQLYCYAYEQLRVIASDEKKQSTTPNKNTFQELTSNTTALVNEAYLKLSKIKDQDIKNQKQFYILVSNIIRQILVDQDRYMNAQKRQPIDFNIDKKDLNSILELEQMIQLLSKKHPNKANILILKYFGGCGIKEIAKLEECSQSKIEKDLLFAKAWIKSECN